MTTGTKPNLNLRQLKVLVVFFIVGDVAWFLPSLTASIVKQDAWVSAIAGTLFGWGIAAFIYWFSLQFPGMTLVDIHRKTLGRYAGGLLTLLYAFSLFVGASAEVRAIGQFVTTQIMTETPMRIILLFFSIVVISAVASGLNAFAITAQLFFLVFIALFIMLFSLQIAEVEYQNLLPFMNSSVTELSKGAMYMIAFPYCQLIAFLMIFPSVEKRERSFRGYMSAVMTGGVIIVILVFLSLLVLGAYLTEQQIYSTYTMAKKINIGNFLQRLEFILIISYLLSTYFKCVIALYAANMSLQQLFKLRSDHILIVPLGFMLFGFSYVIAPDIVFFSSLGTPWALWEYANVLLLVLLVYGIYRFTKGRNRVKPTT